MLEIKFNVSFKGNLGTIFKDIDIVADGINAKVELDLKEVLNIHANFKIGENSFTDLVDIIDIDEQLIKIPFKTDVIKKGVNEFELVATMKDGSVKASQTYAYKVVDSLENPNAVESETNYPLLINLLQDVEETLEKTKETLEKAEEGLNKINEATESIDEIKDFIENSQLNNYATKDELPTKVSQLENDNKYISEIPGEYITESELTSKGYLTEHQDISGKADKTELHNHTNKTVLDAITSVKVQLWDNKSTFSGDYNDLTNKPSIPSINGLATEEFVNEEIKKIDVTEQLTDYAKKTELHTHTNKSVLDAITSTKVAEWNNKSTFDGNYNSLTNKPSIPTKVSQLTNDSGYITSIPSEYVTETKLNAKGYATVNQMNNKADKVTGVFYIEGDSTTAGVWTGHHEDITEYYSGLMINYKTNVAGASGGSTLNINNLGAVNVVRNATTAVTTTYAVGSIINLTYTLDDGTAYWKVADYDANTKNTTGTSNKTGSKMFIVGATSQTSSGTTTYTNTNCYIGTDNKLYSGGNKVIDINELEAKGYLTEHQDISGLATKEYVDNAITNLNIDIDYDSLLAFDTNEIITNLNYVDNNNNIILDDDLPSGTYTLKYELEDGTYTDIKNFIIYKEGAN